MYYAVKDHFPEVLEHAIVSRGDETEKLYTINLRKYETGISQVKNVLKQEIMKVSNVK
jgi:hypothetical protein